MKNPIPLILTFISLIVAFFISLQSHVLLFFQNRLYHANSYENSLQDVRFRKFIILYMKYIQKLVKRIQNNLHLMNVDFVEKEKNSESFGKEWVRDVEDIV